MCSSQDPPSSFCPQPNDPSVCSRSSLKALFSIISCKPNHPSGFFIIIIYKQHRVLCSTALCLAIFIFHDITRSIPSKLSFFSCFLCHGASTPSWSEPSHCSRFTITSHTTLGETPPYEWSARRRDLYLITHNTHKGHSFHRLGSNPQSQQARGRRPTPETARPLGPAFFVFPNAKLCVN